MQEPTPTGLTRFSFWKPEPIPPKDASIMPVELHSLGPLKDVAEKLLDVPRMASVQPMPWDQPEENALNLIWEVEEGVILQIRAEQGPPKPGEVITITVAHDPH